MDNWTQKKKHVERTGNMSSKVQGNVPLST